MTRSLSVIIIMICLFGQSFAQSVGIKVGTAYYLRERLIQTERIEGVIAYPLSQKFEVSITSGYYPVHYAQYAFPGHENAVLDERGVIIPAEIYPAYTYQIIPIIAGIKYTILRAAVSPYLSIEYGRLYDVGNEEARLASFRGNKKISDQEAKGNVLALGGGFQYHITSNLLFDFSAKYNNSDMEPDGIEFMAGVFLPL
jgi:hypothetical protein